MDDNTLVCCFFFFLFFYNATRAVTCSYKYLLGKMLNKKTERKSRDLRVLELLATLNKTNFTVHRDVKTSELKMGSSGSSSRSSSSTTVCS